MLAKEKEVIISCGQLVEIGGSFRGSSIIACVQNNQVLLDFRTITEEEILLVVKCVSDVNYI